MIADTNKQRSGLEELFLIYPLAASQLPSSPSLGGIIIYVMQLLENITAQKHVEMIVGFMEDLRTAFELS